MPLFGVINSLPGDLVKVRFDPPEMRESSPVNYLTRTSHLYIRNRIFSQDTLYRRNRMGA